VFILLVIIFSLVGHGVLVGNPISYAQSVNSTIPSNNAGVKITYPKANSTIPIGILTINGTSSDTTQTDCKVFVDWNDLKPMQNVTPAGINGTNDYSSWKFTYNQTYHNITQGPNELTSKIICINNPSGNSTTKFYSINVTGTLSNTSSSPSSSSSSTSPPAVPASLNDSEGNSSAYHTISYQGILPQYNNGTVDKNEEEIATRNENNAQNVPFIKVDSNSGKKQDGKDSPETTNKESKFMGSAKEGHDNVLTISYDSLNEKLGKAEDERIRDDYKSNNVGNNMDSDKEQKKQKDTTAFKVEKIKKKFQKSFFEKISLDDRSELEKSIKATVKKRLGKVIQNLLN
jgi:hypothetical protein